MFNKAKEPKAIEEFQEEYRFLSNMWECPVYYDDMLWSSAEHAYQAAKTLIKVEKDMVMASASPYAAKKAGRMVTLREDWDNVRLEIMHDIVLAKFSLSPLRERLLETGERTLREGNSWNDTFWGVCDGIGKNHLGRTLMTVRIELRKLQNLTL